MRHGNEREDQREGVGLQDSGKTGTGVGPTGQRYDH